MIVLLCFPCIIFVLTCIFCFPDEKTKFLWSMVGAATIYVLAVVGVGVFHGMPSSFVIETGRTIKTCPVKSLDKDSDRFVIGIGKYGYYLLVENSDDTLSLDTFNPQYTKLDISDNAAPYIQTTRIYKDCSRWWWIADAVMDEFPPSVLTIPSNYQLKPLTDR